MKRSSGGELRQFTRAMLGLSALSISLFGLGVLRGNGWSDWYLIWNLFLAWLPFVFACLLVLRLRQKEWSSWSGIGLTLAWLVFLPNSFYMVSDLIHLEDMARKSVLFDSLTFTTFVINGLLLGYASLYLIQRLMRERGASPQKTGVFAVASLLVCSFAIYLGRDLRWNSWDVVVNPAGIIFDVSERILDPLDHPDTFTTTGVFFVFLFGLYLVLAALSSLTAKDSRYARRR
jgi:uncharacterized membrane protein